MASNSRRSHIFNDSAFILALAPISRVSTEYTVILRRTEKVRGRISTDALCYQKRSFCHFRMRLSCRESRLTQKELATGTFSVAPPELRAESVFMEAHHRRLPRAIIDGHNVESHRAFSDMTFRKKSLRGANHQALLLFGDA